MNTYKILKKIIIFIILLNLKLNCVHAVLIVGAGLPASGKSSTMKELAKIYETENLFLEPEESTWPEVLTKGSIIDPINIITWLRSIRVSMLLQAHALSSQGEVAIVDSYYDKLLYKYIGNKDHEWLINSNHKYFDVLQKMAELDFINLPIADYIIFFKIEEETWKKFLTLRNRGLDKKIGLINYYHSEESILNACKYLSNTTHAQLIIYQQDINLSPQQNALEIYNILKSY